MAEKLWLLICSFFVGIWTVRALGPTDYGALSAALSIAAVFAAVASVGLDNVLLAHFAKHAARSRDVLVASVALRLIGAALHLGLCMAASLLLLDQASSIGTMTALAASAALFRALDAVTLQWQVDEQYARAVGLRVIARACGDLLRVALLIADATVVWFAAAVLFEAAVSGALLADRARVRPSELRQVDRDLLKGLVAQGLPVAVSSLVAALYARFDQVAITTSLGTQANGYYASAARISELFTIFAVSIGSVYLPRMARTTTAGELTKSLTGYVRRMTWAGVGVSALTCLLAEPIVLALYGAQYAPAASLLMIHAWTVPMVFVSIAMEPWFYLHGRVGLYVWKTLLGLIVCIPCVMLGLAWFGAQGVAVAVIITYSMSVLFSNALIPDARPAWRLQLRALMGIGTEPTA